MALLDAELGAIEKHLAACMETHTASCPHMTHQTEQPSAGDSTCWGGGAHFTTRTEDGVVRIVATLGDK
jgi:hypothetical protein